ncbi:MAG: hypothetical protein WBC22_09555 [Sedimentisphaerales bacterium]
MRRFDGWTVGRESKNQKEKSKDIMGKTMMRLPRPFGPCNNLFLIDPSTSVGMTVFISDFRLRRELCGQQVATVFNIKIFSQNLAANFDSFST